MTLRKHLGVAVATLAAAASVAASMAAPAWAADRRVTIVNKTGYTMVRFYASSVDARGWEEDILGVDTLPSGRSVRVNIDDGSGACMYDFKAVFNDGDELTRSAINVCRIATYTYN